MTIRTQQSTFIDFAHYPIPTPSITFIGNAEIFPVYFQMMELQGFCATIISAELTPAPFVLYGHHTDFVSTSFYFLNQVVSSVLVCSSFFSPHRIT